MKPLTINTLRAVLEKAKAAGAAAAKAEVEKQRQESNSDGPFDNCGGAYIVLKIRRNSSLAKLIDANRQPLPNVSLGHSGEDRGYVLHLNGMAGRQEKYINRLAEATALQVLEQELAVSGRVRSYDS